jgi:hypothetical protein
MGRTIDTAAATPKPCSKKSPSNYARTVRGTYRIHTLIRDAVALKSASSRHAIGSTQRSNETLIVSALSQPRPAK